ncbi:MAG: hypothetical protein ABIV48_03255, partial [Pyrinomonadaceae bacterium]
MVNVDELRALIASRHEWLLIRGSGMAFPLLNHEIEITGDGEPFRFAFLDDRGLHSWRLNNFENIEGELAIDVAGAFSKNRETIRLVPRVAASELTAEIEIARLIKANEIAKLIAENFPCSKIGRVALNTDGGRLAQITFQTNEKRPMAAMADVTGALTAESIFTAAMLWAEKLGLRKNPVNEIWLICEKRSVRAAQKLHALFT